MLADKVKRQLEVGGYQKIEAPNLPYQILVRREGSMLYAICLIEDAAVFQGQSRRLDGLQEAIRLSLEQQFSCSCGTLALVLSDDTARDRVLTGGSQAVWLIDPSGSRIVFDNQPGAFGDAEKLLEKKVYPWSGLLNTVHGQLPWVTLILAGINILVQVIVACQERITGYSALLQGMVLQIGEFYASPQYYRLLTSAFLHFGWEHLFNNMLVLLYLGKAAEQIAGRTKFLLAYLFCAVGANIASVIWYMRIGHAEVATAGASGAIFAVAGMILIWLILSRGRLEQVTFRRIAMMMLFTIYHGLAESGINNCAHIAGALLGIFCGFGIWLVSLRNSAEVKS